nr:hypothetical protein [Tanacetum cinerariifolium]
MGAAVDNAYYVVGVNRNMPDLHSEAERTSAWKDLSPEGTTSKDVVQPDMANLPEISRKILCVSDGRMLVAGELHLFLDYSTK